MIYQSPALIESPTPETERRNSLFFGRRTSLSFLPPATKESSPTFVEMEEEILTNDLEGSFFDELYEYDPTNFTPTPVSNSKDADTLSNALSEPMTINRRSSLGISTEDLFEFTDGSSTRDPSRKRCSLDMIFHPSKPLAPSSVIDPATHSESSMVSQDVESEAQPTSHVTKFHIKRTSMSFVSLPMPSGNDQNLEPAGPFPPTRRISLCMSPSNGPRKPQSSLDPMSPGFSLSFANDYKFKLENLIHCMDESESSRREVLKVKLHMKRQLKAQRLKLEHSLNQQRLNLRKQQEELRLLQERAGSRSSSRTGSPIHDPLSSLSTTSSKTPSMSISCCAIKESRRKQRRCVDSAAPIAADSIFSPMAKASKPLPALRLSPPVRRVSRRRSSLAVQSFKKQFFPDCT